MRRCTLLLTFLFLLASNLHAGDIRRIKKVMEKADYEKAEFLIKRSLEDGAINPGVKYFYSVLFLTPEFEHFSIDSATLFIRQAIADFSEADDEVLEEMIEEEIFIETLKDHLENITDIAFERAHQEATVSGWKEFLVAYPEAKQHPLAVDNRDSLAFNLVDVSSPTSLREYLKGYPNSKFSSETQNILDQLLVSKFWKSKSSENLQSFIQENPQSEYRETAIRHLLKLWTISGEADDFLSFIRMYPSTKATTQAVEFLYHLDKEQNFKDFTTYIGFHPKSDSLRMARDVASKYMFPIFDQSYHLVSLDKNVTNTQLSSIRDKDACNGFPGDIISGEDANGSIILTKGGEEIIEGELIQNLGSGFLLVKNESTQHVYHKSGARILKDIEDAQILNSQFIAVKKGDWALYSLSGISLTEHRFDNIFVEGSFWFFEKDALIAVSSSKEIVNAFPEGLFLEFKFEDYELVDNNLLIGYRKEMECLLQSTGEFLVPWGEHHIYPDESNGYVRSKKGYAFYGPQIFTYYPYLEVNDGFILRKEGRNQWMLFSNKRDWFIPLKDSVKLLSDHCALITGDSTRLIFQNQRIVDIEIKDIPRSLDLESSFTLIGKDTLSVIDKKGIVLFSGEYDTIELLNDSLFAISVDEKYGVIDKSGGELLPIEYNYLNLSDELISFVSNEKIGAYDIHHKVQFDPIYESRIERFKYLYMAKKEGLAGLISKEGTEVLSFEYEEILEWTDSLVWVKEEDNYSLINLNNQQKEMEVDLLKSFMAGNSKLMKFYDSDGFGLIGESGILLKPIYSDIVWIGDHTQGVIMADQSLPDAGFHVVTYFDVGGNKIYSQAYSNENFEKVLCDP